MLWLTILLLYPLILALPQELIIRVFIFHRYRALFPGTRTLPLVSAGVFALAHLVLGVSAGVFALAHLVLGNWVAVLLSLAGGLVFAYTYPTPGRVRSAWSPLWGYWLFTVGIGSYFYGGHV